MISDLGAARTQEIERARLAEAAAVAKCQEQVRSAESRLALVCEDLDEAEAEVNRLGEVCERLAADLERERTARVELEDTRKRDAQQHSAERLTLTEALSRARDDTAANAASRAQADADAAAAQVAASSAQATAAAAAAELDRVRDECAQLRSRNEELVRLLTRAEVERNRALADLRKAVAMPAISEEQVEPVPVTGRPRVSRKQRRTEP